MSQTSKLWLCGIWKCHKMSHFFKSLVQSYVYLLCLDWARNGSQSCRMCEWVMSHIWKSHGIHMHESRHMDEWVMTQLPSRHVTHIYEPYHTHLWIMSHSWISHGTRRWWVMSHAWTSHVTHLKVPYHACVSRVSKCHSCQSRAEYEYSRVTHKRVMTRI